MTIPKLKRMGSILLINVGEKMHPGNVLECLGISFITT